MAQRTSTTRNAPFISVVIDNYNYGPLVVEAMASALQFDTDLVEVIVVDDGSKDSSREVLQPFADRVHLILKQNGGQASALNAGFAAAKGEWICFLDADDILLGGFTAIVLEHACPEVAKITWQMPVIGPDGRLTGTALPPPAGDPLLDKLCALGPFSFACSPCSGNVWARRFLDAVMPIPETAFRRGADGYLLQISPIYGKTAVASQPGSAYRRHGSNFLAAKSEFQIRDTLRQRYTDLADAVALHLLREGLHFCRRQWKHEHWDVLDEIERTVTSLIPGDAPVVLVDDDILNVGDSLFGRPRLHLSTDHRGHYAGPPASSAPVITELRRYANLGVRDLVFVHYSFWWLDYYDDLRAEIEAHFDALHRSKGLILYRLRDAA